MTDTVITLAIHGTLLWMPAAAASGPPPVPLIGDLRFREVYLAPVSAGSHDDCPVVTTGAWRLVRRR